MVLDGYLKLIRNIVLQNIWEESMKRAVTVISLIGFTPLGIN